MSQNEIPKKRNTGPLGHFTISYPRPSALHLPRVQGQNNNQLETSVIAEGAVASDPNAPKDKQVADAYSSGDVTNIRKTGMVASAVAVAKLGLKIKQRRQQKDQGEVVAAGSAATKGAQT